MAMNYYAINKVLKGQMRPVGPVRFGHSRLLQTTASVLWARPRTEKHVSFTFDMDAKVAQAFEDVRGPELSAPERIMWDLRFATAFYRRTRELGVHAPDDQIGRRLINIRKNKARYSKRGITLRPSEEKQPRPSIVPLFAHAVEFALMRLKNIHGASIDDILLSPRLGAEYEGLARSIAGDLPSIELRLAALYVRKTQYFKKDELELLAELDPHAIEQQFIDLGALDRFSVDEVPKGPGIVEFTERGEYLFVNRALDLPRVVHEFASDRTLRAMGNHFWVPKRDVIHCSVFRGAEFAGFSLQWWHRKLIEAHEPLFNWPVKSKQAA